VTPPVAGPELIVVDDPAAAVAAGAERVAAALAAGIAERGEVHWATTGGSSAVGLYRHLIDTPLHDGVDWGAVHVWWGDDRFVPRDHPLSNVKPFDDVLFDIGETEEGTAGGAVGLPFDVARIHPFPTTEAIGHARGAAWCASALADRLRDVGPLFEDGWPVFDLVILGVGADGHILSIFPGSNAFDAGFADLGMAIPAPMHIEPHVERVTLHPAIVGAARTVLVVASGAEKAPVLGDIFGDVHDPARWPAQLARREGATWILDRAAAGRLAR
jgi:6-phosphogluconolactonase